jgi:hypothetical protein
MNAPVKLQRPAAATRNVIRVAEPRDGIGMWRLRRRADLSAGEYVALLDTAGALGMMMERDGEVVGFALAVADEDTLRLADAVAPTGADLALLLGRMLAQDACCDTTWIDVSPHCDGRVIHTLSALRHAVLAKTQPRQALAASAIPA